MTTSLRHPIYVYLILWISTTNFIDSNSLVAQQDSKTAERQLNPAEQAELDEAGKLDTTIGALYDEGKSSEAVDIASRVLKIREKVLGPDHPDTAEILNKLAYVYKSQGNYAAAEPLYQRALKIREKAHGPDHSETAISLQMLGLLYEAQGNYADAEPLYRRALKIREKSLGPDHQDTANCLSSLGLLYYLQGNFTAAEPLLQRTLKIFEKSVGPEHPNTVASLSNLASLYQEQGNYTAAEPLLLRALKIREKAHGPDHPKTATSLNNLALLYNSQGNYAAAEPLLQRALKIKEKAFGPDHPATATSLNNLAALYESQGNYAAAEPLHRRALKITEKALGPDHRDTAVSLNNLASLYESQANYAAAEPLFQRALKIREKALGPDHPETALSLNNLAGLYKSQGNYAAAIRLMQRALEICEKALGPDHPDTATSLNNLAHLYDTQGNYAAAEPLLKRALKIQEKALGPEHPDTAISLNNLASLYFSQSNYAAAEPLFQRALKIHEKAVGANHPITATSLNNLATLYRAQGNYVAAEPLLQRALKINEKAFGPDHPATALSLNNLAMLYDEQGNYAAVEPLHQRALKIREKALGPDHPDIAMSLNNLALLYNSQGNYAAAEPLYQRALKIYEKALGPDHPDTALSLNNLALQFEELGQTSISGNTFDRARHGIRRHVARQLPMLSEKEQEQFLKNNYIAFYKGALTFGLIHSNDADSARMSAAWLINGKAVGQEALAQRNLLTRDIDDPKLANLVKELLQVRRQLAAVAMNAAEPSKSQARLESIAKLTTDEQRLSRELGNAGAGVNVDSGDWIELDAIRKALPADTVLIDIARFDVVDFAAKGKESRWKPAHYAAWITRGGGGKISVVVDLGLADEIDELVERARQGVQAASGSGGTIAKQGDEAATAAVMRDLNGLADRVWKPLEEHLAGCKQIVLSPDGALWLTPWSALPVGTGSDKFLLEQYGLRFVVSGRDLVAKPTKRKAAAPVIVANPSFDQKTNDKQTAIQAIFKELSPADDTTTRSFSAKSLIPKVLALPNTGIEALAISPNIEKYAGIKPVMYTERYALESVAKKLHGPRVATFATHGFFLPSQEVKLEDRQRGFGSDSTRSVALDTTGKPIENPLLRCGLLLAGCNNRDSAVWDDDGILTGMEIVSCDFRGTELVVLSACETGLGDVKNGEGVAGLRQAFQLAGAEAVVATLWQVPDRDSALLMSNFFENLASGMSKSDAMRAAQLDRIAKRRERYGAAHPFYWAAFTLTGQ